MRAERYVSAYDLAVIHVGLGETDPALALLQGGLEERTHWMALVGVDPRLDPLGPNPVFQGMLKAMRLEPR